MTRKENIADAFIRVGKIMAGFGESSRWDETIRLACNENGWFTPHDIAIAARSIAFEMLEDEKLRTWLDGYPFSENPKDVAVVMAGNIPFAGFFDMLCVTASGHRCIAKYSSKDRVLMELATEILKDIYPGISIKPAGDVLNPDAVIASGSDNAIRHLKYTYGTIPALYRGNRSSAAILDGKETPEDLMGLASDIFTYNGLGCRNVSHLVIPADYDMQSLAAVLSEYPAGYISPKYINNFRQRKSVLSLSDKEYVSGSFFLLRENSDFPASVSEITYKTYRSPHHGASHIASLENRLQCVIASENWDKLLAFPAVRFGRAQSPTLFDFPDRKDTMSFLANL